jgi:hypothetical protein
VEPNARPIDIWETRPLSGSGCEPSSSIGLMVVTSKNPLNFTAARIVAYAIVPSPPS